ncbi:MAG: cation:proton antiporter subunit C [Pseudomonadota bacterium]
MPEGERTGAASNSLFSSADQSSPPSDAQRNIDRFDVDVAAATPSPRSENIVEATADILYSNPLPHVLILTAIVVGVATTAVGLAIAVRIREAYGTIEEDALEQMDNQAEFGGTAPQSDEGSRA